jgi:two-component system sensor histidine kinase/response regulator
MNGPANPSVDLKAIDELRNLDDGQGEVLRQLVRMFVESAPGRIALIERGLATGDLKTSNHEAHSLKSSSANLGAHRMASLCQKIESAKTPEAASQVAALPMQLKAEFELVRTALAAFA